MLAGIFNSIPYLGPLLVTGGLGVVAFMQFDDLPKTAYICGITLAITSLEGWLLTPALMSRAAQMNPVAIFVGLLFWSWVWGVWGTILAVPMMMMVKAICDHDRGSAAGRRAAGRVNVNSQLQLPTPKERSTTSPTA